MKVMTSTATLILQELMSNGDNYGLGLIDSIGERTQGRVDLKSGVLYPALRSLKTQGLITSYKKKGHPSRAGRPRIYYSLTPKGHRVAAEQRTLAGTIFNLLQDSKDPYIDAL